jgi:serine phosphatase RsbU (regulator of sigma subunit)
MPHARPATDEQETVPGAIGLVLVEDDDGDALLVEDELAEMLPGAEIQRCRTLKAALELPRGGIDCVLVDLGLPDANGASPVAQLRARLGSVPLVVLTGLADEAAGVAALQDGAQDYLVKGRLEAGRLARAIRYAVGRRQIEEAERELLLADAQSREIERLERGLAPAPLVDESVIWVASCTRVGRSRALLGGDFFDLVQSSAGNLHAVIGDVCGHGTDEAAIGVNMRAAWRALSLTRVPQVRTLETMQRVFEQERHLPRLFATLFAMELDPQLRTAQIVLAGHPRPLLIDGASVSSISDARGGAAIGIGPNSWPSETLQLPPGWAMLLYTDGIIEGRVGSGSERLGEAGLQEMVADRIGADPGWRARPRELLDRLLEGAEELNRGPLSDDVAMLLFGERDGLKQP